MSDGRAGDRLLARGLRFMIAAASITPSPSIFVETRALADVPREIQNVVM
jgi:hypothetical protein